MKRPTKPPLPPVPPSSRGRKDVAYTPSQGMPAVGPASTRSVAPMRAPPQLPSQVGADSDDPYDLLEDLATPTRAPDGASQPLPTGPINLPTGPMQAFQPPPPPPPSMPIPMAPPSQRASGMQAAFAPPPPSQRGAVTAPPGFASGPMSVGPVPAGPMSAGPISTPSPLSGPRSGPMSVPHQQTGPMPALQRPPEYSTGSYPTGTGQLPPSSSQTRMTKPDDGVPLGYVVASAFFLAIALVGFGLYLAFEVISL